MIFVTKLKISTYATLLFDREAGLKNSTYATLSCDREVRNFKTIMIGISDIRHI